MLPLQDLNVAGIERLPSPSVIKKEFDAPSDVAEMIATRRDEVRAVLAREDRRLLVVVGPCSVHDPVAARDYAHKLATLQKEVAGQMLVLMRVYFEKPRTTIGWKGLINDPHLDGSQDIETGLRLARKLLLEISAMGLSTATEFLDPIVPQYISDLVTWAAVGARTTESQTHREMASGLSMPVGFKNGTDGSLQIAIDAMGAARCPHSFLGIDQEGATCIVRTKGNPWGHVVLRGGSQMTNYDPTSIAAATEKLRAAHLSDSIMVDCSHANSGKKPARQEIVWRDVLTQKANGTETIAGVMLESFLKVGSQPFPRPLSALEYGLSITDPCLDWTTTETLIREGAQQLAAKS